MGAPAYLLIALGLRYPTSPIVHAEAEQGGSDTPLSDFPLPVLTLLLVCTYFQMAMADLLVEARCSERLKLQPDGGPLLVTFVWGGMQVLSLAANCVADWLIPTFGPSACYLVAAPLAAVVGLPAALNYLEEARLAVGECFIRADKSKWSGAGRVPFVIGSAIGTSGVALALLSVFVRSLRI